ncbi:MAG TPA: phosphoadenosine phosphosulfate reductase family protein [Acidobacteriota bacterium]|nr:phosphoadenosine phosphosulfate reductase family protein [Acidobacteriota bacterium]
MTEAPRHILSLSGGKDSAALAVYMRDRVQDMEYIFHDTGKELPETYDYIARLQDILGRRIVKTTPEDPFDHWLSVYGDMLPSGHRRWCTKMLKLKPFETYVGEGPVINYVGLRADEARIGYISTKPNITAVYPFREDGLVRADIIRILEESGLGLPPYMDWGRSRSGCFFCFFQQKIEWVRLKRTHPGLYEEAKAYEVRSLERTQGFTWAQNESLEELEQPERIAAIEANWEREQERRKKLRANLPLAAVLADADVDPEERDGCLICSL